jgi:hypothetical protein
MRALAIICSILMGGALATPITDLLVDGNGLMYS